MFNDADMLKFCPILSNHTRSTVTNHFIEITNQFGMFVGLVR